MKAKRLKPGEFVNPNFSRSDKEAARLRGEEYPIREFLEAPAGQIVDDPDCWRLCLGSDPVMCPADAECLAKVRALMSSPKRAELLRKIEALSVPEVYRQLSKPEKLWVDTMRESYSGELAGGVPVVELAKPEPVSELPAGENSLPE